MNVIAPRLQSHWDWRAAGNFIGGGTGTGLYVFTTLGALAGIPQPWLSLLALALVAAGLSLVLLEIGRPWRFINVIFHPQTSWMTREALVAVPLMTFGLAGAWFGWRALLVVAAVCGIGFLYCQARMLRSAKGIPAWRTPKIVPLLITTGLCEGAGLFLAAVFFLSPVSPRIATIIAVFALLALLTARVWFWLAYRRSLAGGEAPDLAVATLSGINFWFLGLGHLLPVIILAGSLLLPEQAAILHALAGLFALAGGWLLKFTIVTRAAFTQGYALLQTPAREVRSGGGPGTKPGWS
jgi:phenylacetyl-CoA:acceptor oxidoreductase subunit 2